MNHLAHVRLVAGWEFRRYFKWKDQLLGFLIFVGFSVLAGAVGRFTAGERGVLAVATSGIDLPLTDSGRVRVVPLPPDSTTRMTALEEGDLHGILSRRADGSFELLVAKRPRYLPELHVLLADHVQRERMAAAGISPSELARLLAPPALQVRYADRDRGRAGRAEVLVAAICLGLVLLAVFSSMAYMLTGITGEKQLRVTESITAIVPPQAWIDGKIIGIGAYALATTANMAVGGVLLGLVAKLTWGLAIPDAVVRPDVIVTLVLFSVLALLLWNAFFAAFASTIDDPNTSTRSTVMFLPLFALGFTFTVLRNPDAMSSRVLSWIPFTSPSAMPARVMLSDPGPGEIIAALVLLMATVWLVRRAAGRIFEVGMLMYGKEPSLREMLRWALARTDGGEAVSADTLGKR